MKTLLVPPRWLERERGKSDLKIVDAPFYLPGDPRTPEGVYSEGHIPGAVLFDLNKIIDPYTDLPHMAASPQAFAEAVGALGIGDGDRVVIYDHMGLMSAARVWWNFRLMGLDEVYVLDGGLPAWFAEDRPVEQGPPPTVTAKTFTPHPRPQLLRSMGAVKQALADGVQVLDARSAGRFSGADPEPRAGLSSGHMPGALNLPFGAIVEGGRLVEPAALQKAFDGAGVDTSRPIIATCGSGVTAAVLALGLARLGHWDTPVYDGSWTEWANTPGNPIVKD